VHPPISHMKRLTRSRATATITVVAALFLLGSGGSAAAAGGSGWLGHRLGLPSAWGATYARLGGIFGQFELRPFGGYRFGGGPALTTAVGGGPFAVAVDQASHTAYIGNTNDNTVSVINIATCNASVTTSCGQVHSTINLGAGPDYGPVDAVVDDATDTVYLVSLFSSSGNGDKVWMVNGATCNASVVTGCGQIPMEITVGNGPDGLAVDEATDTIYVANVADNTISVIDGATCNGEVSSGCGQTPATIANGFNGPAVPAVDEATDTIYVPNSADGTVSVINGAGCNATVTAGCGNTPAKLSVGEVPNAVAVDQATDTVYVAVASGSVGSVAVINGATCDSTVTSGCGQTPASVPAGANADDLVVDPITQSVFVVNQNDSTLSVIDGAICNAVQKVGCGQRPPAIATGYLPGYLDLDIASDTVYVANYNENTVSVLSGGMCTLTSQLRCRHPAPTTTVGAGPGEGAVNEATGTLYVSNSDGNDVSVISTASCNAFITFGCARTWPTVATGNFPGGVAVDPQTDTIYVVNLADNTVSRIDGATCNATNSSDCGQNLTPIAVGMVPVAVDVDDANHTAYVANVGDGTISMINTKTCNGSQASGCALTQSQQTIEIAGTNIPDGFAVDEKTDTIYMTNSGSGATTVSVINGATCNATDTGGCSPIGASTVGAAPSGLAINELTDTVYSVNLNSGDVSVINGATCNATNQSGCNQSPPTLGTGTAPSAIAVDQATDQVYVSSQAYSDTDVYNGATCRGTVSWGCQQPPLVVQLGGNPGNPVVDLAHDTVYVPDASDAEVSYFPAGF